MLTIRKAAINHIEQIAPLFNQYRIFYKQASNLLEAKEFLDHRLKNNESVIFLAYFNNESVGFTQLYTSFSSVSLQPFFILNDLFVKETHRGKGIGKALLNKAKALCKEQNYKGLALETAKNNPAQKLYENLGWKKDTDCFHYFWTAN